MTEQKLAQQDARLQSREIKHNKGLKGCLTRGLIAALAGLGACSGIAAVDTAVKVATGTPFDYQVGNINFTLQKEQPGGAGTTTYTTLFLVNNCFWGNNYANGHLINHFNDFNTGLIGQTSTVIDVTPWDCKK